MTPHLFWHDILLRLLAAIALGALLGWNPQRAHKPAGVRTHIFVSLGSALAMIISLELFLEFSGRANIDPGRIAGQVISGIGFIGAGTIIRGEFGLVRGLTTAASVWAVAGVGLACGAGLYLIAAMAAVLAVVSIQIVNIFLSVNEGGGPEKKDKTDD